MFRYYEFLWVVKLGSLAKLGRNTKLIKFPKPASQTPYFSLFTFRFSLKQKLPDSKSRAVRYCAKACYSA